jgi:hypothetical protein
LSAWGGTCQRIRWWYQNKSLVSGLQPSEKKRKEDAVEVANIYDNGPISPIARIKDNLSVWSEQKWLHFNITYIEPIPFSSPFMVNMLAVVPAVATLAAGGTMVKKVIPVLQLNDNELIHLRWKPLDDVEGRLYELGAAARFSPRGGHARVTLFTELADPVLATTTFWILGGQNKDAQFDVINPDPVNAIPVARFAFWGFRYILQPLGAEPQKAVCLPAQAWQ